MTRLTHTRRPKNWALRVWGALLGAMLAAFVAFGAPGSAHAADGKPAGWSVELATSRIGVGRVVLEYEPQLHGDAMELVDQIPEMWSEIEQTLARDLDDSLRISFVEHAGRVAEATDMPKWVAGVAHSSTGEIMIARHGPDGSPTDLTNLLRHEMAHVALYRATNGASLPRWFHEGVAESMETGVSFERAQTLASVVFGPGVPDMDRLEAQFHGSDGPQASAAYAAARDLVLFMRQHDPDGMKFRQLLSELRAGHNFEVATVRAYNRSLQEIVAQWRAGLTGRFVWYPLAAGGGLPFALVLPLVLVAWVRRRRVLREGWERLEREEALEAQALA